MRFQPAIYLVKSQNGVRTFDTLDEMRAFADEMRLVDSNVECGQWQAINARNDGVTERNAGNNEKVTQRNAESNDGVTQHAPYTVQADGILIGFWEKEKAQICATQLAQDYPNLQIIEMHTQRIDGGAL